MRSAFLAAVAETPDDDAPRLVFSDWLEEQGDLDRAELIRVQCRLARADDADRPALKRREGELLQRGQEAWLAELPALDGVRLEDFARGFAQLAIAETAEAFLAAAPRLFASAPIRILTVRRADAASCRLLAESRWTARLRELNLGHNPIGAEGVARLAGSPGVANLASLLLHDCSLGDAGADLLARSPLPALEELYLSGNGLTDEAATVLARSPNLAALEDLDLRDNRIGDAGARELASAERRTALATLYLTNNAIGPDGAEALAWSERFPKLAPLYLNHNAVGDRGAIALAESPPRAALRELDLRNCGIGDAGGAALARSPYLGSLERVRFSWNGMMRDTWRMLRERFGNRLRG